MSHPERNNQSVSETNSSISLLQGVISKGRNRWEDVKSFFRVDMPERSMELRWRTASALRTGAVGLPLSVVVGGLIGETMVSTQ